MTDFYTEAGQINDPDIARDIAVEKNRSGDPGAEILEKKFLGLNKLKQKAEMAETVHERNKAGVMAQLLEKYFKAFEVLEDNNGNVALMSNVEFANSDGKLPQPILLTTAGGMFFKHLTIGNKYDGGQMAILRKPETIGQIINIMKEDQNLTKDSFGLDGMTAQKISDVFNPGNPGYSRIDESWTIDRTDNHPATEVLIRDFVKDSNRFWDAADKAFAPVQKARETV